MAQPQVSENTMKIKKTPGEQVFDIFNAVFMVLLMIVTLYPFYYVLAASFSMPAAMAAHRGPLLFPDGFQVESYKLVFANPDIASGFLNTIFYVIAGTILNILLTLMMAYVLSRKDLMLKKILMWMIMFTMFFGGGMIPTYIMMSQIGVMGTRFSVILPGLIGVTNVIIMRTAFQGVPDGLEESARIDGANDIVILWKVMVPLVMPTIAVMILFYGVGHWNSWFNAMLYLRDRGKFPLQLILREILVYSGTGDMLISWGQFDGQDMSEIIKYSTIIVSTVPIICIYPFLQKHFVKGVMIGAIKG